MAKIWLPIVVLFVGLRCLLCSEDGFCSVTETADTCSLSALTAQKRYLFYNINPSEGFNLRRDVYMRLAVFMHKWTQSHPEWVLVLPPWDRLYHWKSNLDQRSLPWSHFFEVESLNMFAPVIDMNQLEEQIAEVDQVYYLQHFPEAFTSKDWDWSDRFSFVSCDDSEALGKYFRDNDDILFILGGRQVTAKSLNCTSFQGGASLLGELLQSQSHRKVMIDRAEVVLHDRFGDELYWKCRRSMRFAAKLVEEANSFRAKYLNSSDVADDTNLPPLWTDQQAAVRRVRGGPYVCAHLRRRDFLFSRKNEVPTLKQAALQLSKTLKELNLTTVFVCSDGTREEQAELRNLLKEHDVVTYEPSPQQLAQFGDGGVAIIDQIVCSTARHFIGSHESTFSFRIQEEREIRGFPTEATFNRFCGSNEECSGPSQWKIVF